MSYAIRIEAPALVIKFGTSQEGKKQQKKHIEFTFSSDEKNIWNMHWWQIEK